jgi:guanosine-3',5'-bis(diphosphate) 3'-pyrophosphohydrolase
VVVRIEDILDKAEKYFKPEEIEQLHKAYIFSAKEHKGQVRLSGEPYLSHVLEVANILADMKLDATSVVVGLLHDIVEDTLATVDVIEQYFGPEIAHLVDGVTKISRFSYTSQEDRQADSFRKMLVAMVDDIRVILVKLADRLHNMRTLHYLSPEKQERIARETMEVYAPMAHRLGIGRWRTELEELAFKYLYPQEYARIVEKVEEKRKFSTGFIQATLEKLETLMREHGIPATVEGRVKRYYSIFRKMKDRGVTMEEIMDYIAFRIITVSEKNCYEALGLVHTTWKPIPGRFKDYIAVPKPNLYRSLHTIVVGPLGQPFEIQIRTRVMHMLAEEGVAAHWSYKEGKIVGLQEIQNFAWLRHLVELQREVTDSREFMESVKLELYPDEVYVFTPKGEVRSFKRGATPIDFAYSIHTEVGNHCVGAKVNGKLVPLRTPLRNGDIVEILTAADQRPCRDWLKIATTARAKQKIMHHLNLEQKKTSIEMGRRILSKETHRHAAGEKDGVRESDLARLLPGFGLSKVEELYASIGYGKISEKQVAARLVKAGLLGPVKAPKEPAPRRPEEREVPEVRDTGIRVKGQDDILTYLARCCRPIRGEPIVGYITRGKGIAVHAKDCPNVASLLFNPERRIDVEWEESDESVYPADITVTVLNRPGMLAKISGKIADQNLNIKNVRQHEIGEEKAVLDFTLEIRHIQELSRLCRLLKGIDGVLEAYRSARTR